MAQAEESKACQSFQLPGTLREDERVSYRSDAPEVLPGQSERPMESSERPLRALVLGGNRPLGTFAGAQTPETASHRPVSH